MKQLHHVQCIADGMDFKLSAGVGGTEGAFSCVDENDGGCPTEAYILCAFENIASIGTQVDYLACMDEYSGDTPSARTPAQAASQAQSCAQRYDLVWNNIESCATGARSNELLSQAHKHYEAFKDQFMGFPTPWVNGKQPWSRDWEDLVKAICDAGLSCACDLPPPSPSPQPAPSPVPTPVPSPKPPPSPVPSPVPSPQPTPKPSPVTPGDCFSSDADEATCEATADKSGKPCKWCGPDGFLPCVTQDWGCDSMAV